MRSKGLAMAASLVVSSILFVGCGGSPGQDTTIIRQNEHLQNRTNLGESRARQNEAEARREYDRARRDFQNSVRVDSSRSSSRVRATGSTTAKSSRPSYSSGSDSSSQWEVLLLPLALSLAGSVVSGKGDSVVEKTVKAGADVLSPNEKGKSKDKKSKTDKTAKSGNAKNTTSTTSNSQSKTQTNQITASQSIDSSVFYPTEESTAGYGNNLLMHRIPCEDGHKILIAPIFEAAQSYPN